MRPTETSVHWVMIFEQKKMFGKLSLATCLGQMYLLAKVFWANAQSQKIDRKIGIRILARRARIFIPDFGCHILKLIAA